MALFESEFWLATASNGDGLHDSEMICGELPRELALQEANAVLQDYPSDCVVEVFGPFSTIQPNPFEQALKALLDTMEPPRSRKATDAWDHARSLIA